MLTFTIFIHCSCLILVKDFHVRSAVVHEDPLPERPCRCITVNLERVLLTFFRILALTSHKLTSQSSLQPCLIPMLSHPDRALNVCLCLQILLVLLVGDAVVRGIRALFLELLADGLAVQLLLEDGLRLDGFELGLEVLHVVR